MADRVLSCDYGPICKTGRDVMGEVADDGREDGVFGFVYTPYNGEQVDS